MIWQKSRCWWETFIGYLRHDWQLSVYWLFSNKTVITQHLFHYSIHLKAIRTIYDSFNLEPINMYNIFYENSPHSQFSIWYNKASRIKKADGYLLVSIFRIFFGQICSMFSYLMGSHNIQLYKISNVILHKKNPSAEVSAGKISRKSISANKSNIFWHTT